MSSLTMILRSFHIPQDLDQDLSLLAQQVGASKSQLVREAITLLLERHKEDDKTTPIAAE